MPTRRRRISARKVKCPTSRYGPNPAETRPPTSQNITHLAITIHDGQPTGPGFPSAGDRKNPTLQLLRTDPQRPWTAREIAQGIGCADPQSLRAQLRTWAKQCLLHRVAPATHTLTPEWANPP